MRKIVTIERIVYLFNNEAIALFLFYCISKVYKQPATLRRLFQQYKYAYIFLDFRQWRIANENESLIQLYYERIKRNPE